MDSVYLTHPLLLLFVAALLGMQVLIHFLPRLSLVLTAVSVILHAVFCFCVLVAGGTLYEFVLALLLSCVLSMALGAVEHKKEQTPAEKNEGEETAK